MTGYLVVYGLDGVPGERYLSSMINSVALKAQNGPTISYYPMKPIDFGVW